MSVYILVSYIFYTPEPWLLLSSYRKLYNMLSNIPFILHLTWMSLRCQIAGHVHLTPHNLQIVLCRGIDYIVLLYTTT